MLTILNFKSTVNYEKKTRKKVFGQLSYFAHFPPLRLEQDSVAVHFLLIPIIYYLDNKSHIE